MNKYRLVMKIKDQRGEMNHIFNDAYLGRSENKHL